MSNPLSKARVGDTVTVLLGAETQEETIVSITGRTIKTDKAIYGKRGVVWGCRETDYLEGTRRIIAYQPPADKE
jgi:hypothetical protein